MKRTFGVALTAALAVLLSGCMRMHVNLTLEEGDKASGSMVFAISDTVAEQAGMEPKALLEMMLAEEGDMAPEGSTAEDYAQDGFTGTKWSFESTDIADASTGQDLTIVRDGDDYVVEGEMDMTGEEFAGDELTAGMADSMDIAVSVTFPGEIKESNGEVEGNTVTWQPEAGQVTKMEARGSATADSGINLPLILGIVLGLLVLGAIIAAVLGSKKRKGSKDEPNYEYPTYSQQATFPSETGPGIPTGAGLDGPGVNANAAGAAAGAIAVGAGAAVSAEHPDVPQGDIPVYNEPPTRASLRAAASAPESSTPSSGESAFEAPGAEPVAEAHVAEPVTEAVSIEEPTAPETRAMPIVEPGSAPQAPTRDLFEPLELTEPFVPENDSPADQPVHHEADVPETKAASEDYTQELPVEVPNEGAASEPTQVFPQPPTDPENPENPQQ